MCTNLQMLEKCVKCYCTDMINAWAMLFQQLIWTATEWQDLKYAHTKHGTMAVTTTQCHTAVKSHCTNGLWHKTIHSSVWQYLKMWAWPAQITIHMMVLQTCCGRVVGPHSVVRWYFAPLPHPICDPRSRHCCSSVVTEKGSEVHWIEHKPPFSAYHHWTTWVTGPKALQIPHEVRH